MRVPDASLEQLESQGFTVVPEFLSPDELSAARAALWDVYPTPEQFHANPNDFPQFERSQFAGIRYFPYADWSLNRLAFHPDLVDAAERFLGSTDLELYKVELWAKYSGAIDYAQPHHRDFGNHSLVVPRVDGAFRQMTSFILLSDVSIDDGPTAIVPFNDGAHVPFIPPIQDARSSNSIPFGELFDREIPVVGPAGTLLLYRTDVLHRATAFNGQGRSRFALLADYHQRGASWAGNVAWPNNANKKEWTAAMEQCSVRERDLFGFPKPGHLYWNEQTLCDVSARYPLMDMGPYQAAKGDWS
jgi:Phytanoyl-CoA dioxygenase (PhyH)